MIKESEREIAFRTWCKEAGGFTEDWAISRAISGMYEEEPIGICYSAYCDAWEEASSQFGDRP